MERCQSNVCHRRYTKQLLKLPVHSSKRTKGVNPSPLLTSKRCSTIQSLRFPRTINSMNHQQRGLNLNTAPQEGLSNRTPPTRSCTTFTTASIPLFPFSRNKFAPRHFDIAFTNCGYGSTSNCMDDSSRSRSGATHGSRRTCKSTTLFCYGHH